jgi:hypothetical protein
MCSQIHFNLAQKGQTTSKQHQARFSVVMTITVSVLLHIFKVNSQDFAFEVRAPEGTKTGFWELA